MGSVKVTELQTDSDWRAVRGEVEAFEKECEPNTYMEWGYQYANWSQCPPEGRCWLIRLFEGEMILGMMILVESKSHKFGVPITSLRTMDFGVMHMPPFLMRKGYELEACRALVKARWKIAFVTGASLVKLYKINKNSSLPLVDTLAKNNIYTRVSDFNDSYQLRLHDGIESYLKTKKRKSLYNIRRSTRLLQEETGEILRLERLRGEDLLSNDRFMKYWKCFEDLRSQSWQMVEARKISQENHDRLVNFFRVAVEGWDTKGWLDLVLLWAGKKLVAGQLNTVTNHTQRVILMAYDQTFKNCSPGRVLFFKQMEDAYDRGDRTIILGGASEAGKAFWANQIESTLEITWVLGGARAKAWSVWDQFNRRRAV